MKNITLISCLLLSSPAFSSAPVEVMDVARDMAAPMADDEFCSVLGVSTYSLEGTPEGSLQRQINRAFIDIRYERMRKWSAAQKASCSANELASYKSELCRAEECD